MGKLKNIALWVGVSGAVAAVLVLIFYYRAAELYFVTWAVTIIPQGCRAPVLVGLCVLVLGLFVAVRPKRDSDETPTLREEWKILASCILGSRLSSFTKRCDRIKDWEAHIRNFEHLKPPAPSQTPANSSDTSVSSSETSVSSPETAKNGPWKAHHIEHLWKHLEAIDNKTSRLLTFESVASVTAILTAGGVPPECRWLVGVLLVFWFAATSLCLWASSQIVWGELKLSGNNKVSGEDHFVRELIIAVIERTAKFRVAAFLTFIYVVVAGGLIWIVAKQGKQTPVCCPVASPTPASTATSTPRPPPSPTATPTPMSPISSGKKCIEPFSPGASCSVTNAVHSELEDTAKAIVASHAKDIVVTGFTDGMRINRCGHDQYRNNIELGLSRARCISGWLLEVLSERGYVINNVVNRAGSRDEKLCPSGRQSQKCRFVSICWGECEIKSAGD